MTDDLVRRLREDEITVTLCHIAAARIETLELEVARLQRYESIVLYIVNDSHELSHDKIVWQRNDWRRKCIIITHSKT